MTAIEMYMEGLISLEELIYKLYKLGDKTWIKDCLSSVLNEKNYTRALKIINAL